MSDASNLRKARALLDRAIAVKATRERQARGFSSAEEEDRRKRFEKYIGKPSLYAAEILGLRLWDEIARILDELEAPPYRTAVNSGHKVGKTNASAALINYWFDTYDPGVVITTGASYDAMKDTVWSEVRSQRARAGLEDYFIGPVAPEMRTSPDHWAKLFSVNDATSFQGKHRSRMLFVFDEAVGVERDMFLVAETMFKAEPGFAWITFCNPTDPSSQIYAEQQLTRVGGGPKWRVYSLSSLNHPNVAAQREARARGEELPSSQCPIPSAVSITQVDDWVQDWCQAIHPESATPTDFEWTWPDGRRTWHRPQADWEARCKGVWPSQSLWSVWSDSLFTAASNAVASIPVHLLPEIGCDVARFGDDRTAIHSRWGAVSVGHASRQGLSITETAGWVIEVAGELAAMVNEARRLERAGRPMVSPQEIPIKVDDDGVGGGVVDLLVEQGFNVIPVGAGTTASDPSRYPNKRSELWFQTARRAEAGGVAYCTVGADGVARCRLDMDAVQRLKLQAVAPKWKLDSQGRRVVERKDETKKRLGYSPDNMDAKNLAYYEEGWEPPFSTEVPVYDSRTIGHTAPTGDQVWNDQVPPTRPRRLFFGR